jgi:glycosyltransferase involved in cell wall biosynthesis
MTNLKIVHLQFLTTSASPGNRLHAAFLNAGIESSILSLHSELSGDDRISSLGRKSRWTSKINNKVQEYLTRNTKALFSFPIIGSDISQMEQIKHADIIYIHWVLHGFLSLKNIEQLAKLNKPIIIFMHDMWMVTGGCHHSFTCKKYVTKCHNCELFPDGKKIDLATIEFEKKLKLFSKNNNLFFVSPSKWLQSCAKQSALTRSKPIFYIPNILDNKIFKPFDKKVAKQIFNLDSNKTVIAFGAMSIDSPYKGWEYLQKAFEILYEDEKYRDIQVLIFGSGYNKHIADAIPYKTEFVGFVNSEYTTTLIYNAANIFVAPSVAEAFGYVVLESLCCGTPVVAFETGGIPDIIDHKVNGYLASYRDSVDLARGIKYCIDYKIKGSMQSKFEPSLIVKKHLELLEHTISVKA